MTHRVFSRNLSSSRAIPVKKLIQDVMDDPFVPLFWGRNQPGMQAGEECNTLIDNGIYGPDPKILSRDVLIWHPSPITREDAWLAARDDAVSWAEKFNKAGYHKQIVNRLLEPFAHARAVITATDWSNFFALRRHPAAEPHFRMLADRIWEAMQASKPARIGYGEWHLPYVTSKEWEVMYMSDSNPDLPILREISVARCASVSYKTVDDKPMTAKKARELYTKLVGEMPIHASPAEHQATPDYRHENGAWSDPTRHGNFTGFVQYRKTLPNEHVDWETYLGMME